MSSHVGFVPAGQFALGASEYRAEKPCSRLSLSGNPPVRSFQAHWLMSIGSLDPPPVKKLLLGLGSAVQDTAVAPLVTAAVPQPARPPPVTWLQTLSQSSSAAGVPAVFVLVCASPSSWKMPVSCTACAAYGISNVRTIAAMRGSARERRTRRIPVAPLARVIGALHLSFAGLPGRMATGGSAEPTPLWARSRCHGASHLLRPGAEMEQQVRARVNNEKPDHRPAPVVPRPTYARR